jgi:imidazolonepropionase-like amidohydrolase
LYDLLITGGNVVDPASDLHGQAEVAIQGARVVAVEEGLPRRGARQVVDASGQWVLPGLIDSHVHVSTRPEGYRMMAKAGVTCALDMAGQPEEMIAGLHRAGAGLTVAFLYPLVPGETLSNQHPSRQEIARVLSQALEQGALGVKILGGHYPLSPEATARIVEEAHQVGCWCAMHVGTTATGSNIEGLEEAVALAGGLPAHIAHVNAYCRGQITGDPLLEASRALMALAEAPATRSESYLSPWNGTNARIVDGIPRSQVTRTCLVSGGYPATAAGMEKAIAAGWACIHGARDGEIRLLPPALGLESYRAHNSRVYASFPVNSPGAAISLALAKSGGSFSIDALSTDGGGIPRNTTLEQGLALVRFGAMTMEELVQKACLNPARMLGLSTKGHLRPGADADLIVVDPKTHEVSWTVVEGYLAVRDGVVVGRGGRLLTSERGQAALTRKGVPNRVVAPKWLG